MTNIPIWTDGEPSGVKEALPGTRLKSDVHRFVDSAVLSESLQKFLGDFQDVLDSPEPKDSKFVVDRIELNLAVNAEGGIELIGKLSSSVRASIKVVLNRRKQ